MRYIVRNCSNLSDHPLHVSDPRFSMYSSVEGLERFVCPGGRAGDKKLRDADDIADVVREYDEQQGQTLLIALAESTGRPVDRSTPPSYDEGPDEPPERDFDEEYEADRAADRYERGLDQPWE